MCHVKWKASNCISFFLDSLYHLRKTRVVETIIWVLLRVLELVLFGWWRLSLVGCAIQLSPPSIHIPTTTEIRKFWRGNWTPILLMLLRIVISLAYLCPRIKRKKKKKTSNKRKLGERRKCEEKLAKESQPTTKTSSHTQQEFACNLFKLCITCNLHIFSKIHVCK